MRWCLRFGVRVLSDYNFELELPFSKIGLRLQRGATALLRFISLTSTDCVWSCCALAGLIAQQCAMVKHSSKSGRDCFVRMV